MMEDIIKGIGKMIRWKEKENYIIHQVKQLMMEVGRMTNSMDKEKCTMINLQQARQ